MLLVQQFLQTHSFRELQEQHGVYASFSKSGHKFSLNYDQIEAKENDPLAQECRGLILSSMDGAPLPHTQENGDPNRKAILAQVVPGDTRVLGFPMKRFFNHGQGSAANINWSDPNLAVLEKLDGTLCIVYFDPFTNQWCVATRSVPEADLIMDNGVFTFRTLFEKALYDTTGGLPFDQFSKLLDDNITYCFELTTPYNRIVVNYPDCRITLLAGRKLSNLQEIDPNTIKPDASIPVVQAHSYSSIDELLNWVSSLNPLEHEGVVVRDSDFDRIKVKNAAYVAYNKLHDRLGTSERNCLELILLEKDDDAIPFLPEVIANNLRQIKVGLQNAIEFHQLSYDIVADIANAELPGDKKVFAINLNNLAAQKGKYLWTAPLFQIFSSKVSSMKDFVSNNKKNGTWPDSFLDKLLELSKLHFHT